MGAVGEHSHWPDALALARRNLTTMQHADSEGHAIRVLNQWTQLLNGPIEDIVRVMLSTGSPHEAQLDRVVDDEQLAASNPFAGLLSPKERWKVLQRFRAGHAARASPPHEVANLTAWLLGLGTA